MKLSFVLFNIKCTLLRGKNSETGPKSVLSETFQVNSTGCCGEIV